MPRPLALSRKRLLTLFAIVCLLAGALTMRLLFLSADPPKDITISGGIIGDPGQYQYGARNQVLFGQTSLDGYSPHLLSPLIHPLNVWVYRWFGVNLIAHRSIPLLFSVLIPILFWWAVRRLVDPMTAHISTLFLLFSYPTIVYSHVAYREYPMAFFALAAFLLFARGADSEQKWPFLLSALFFFLSYLSKGSGVYLLAVFYGVGMVWLWERRIRWQQLLFFTLALTGFFAIWWFTVYQANPEFLKSFLADNRNVRRINSLPNLLNNLWQSPMMLILRSDPIPFMVLAVAFFGLIRKRLAQGPSLPAMIDMAFAWLACGTLFHGVVNYRPTRFYLILILPLALLAGYTIQQWLQSSPKRLPGHPIATTLAFPLHLLMLVALGFPAYFGQLPRWSLAQILAHSGVALAVLLLFLLPPKDQKIRLALVALLLTASIASNIDSFQRWARQREYEIPAIVEALNHAIPPARIAGNWASHLSIGTAHKTFYAWKGLYNWNKPFLSHNRIDHLLLAKSRTFDEIADYKNFFTEEWPHTKLLAEFDLLNAKVQLIRLYPATLATPPSGPLEFEAMERSLGRVRYRESASQKLAVVVTSPETAQFTLRETLDTTPSEIVLRAAGRMSVKLFVSETENRQFIVNTRGSEITQVVRRLDPPLPLPDRTLTIEVTPLKGESQIILDSITLKPAQNI